MFIYKTIVVGIDFSPLSETALCAAVALGNRVGMERLHLVHVMQAPPLSSLPFSPSAELALAWESGRKVAEEQLDRLDVPETRSAVTRETRMGAPARELARAALDVKADLVVVASHDRSGLKRVILGSVASALVRAAHCPVLVVGHDRPGLRPFQRILAAVDLSPVSERVLEHAISLAAPHQGGVHALSLYELPSIIAEDVLPRYLTPLEAAQFPERHRLSVLTLVDRVRVPGVDVRVEVMSKGPPPLVVLDVASLLDTELIVLGTSGHNVWHRMFLGSTATRVVSDASCPVLVVPHDAEESRSAHRDRAVDPPRALSRDEALGTGRAASSEGGFIDASRSAELRSRPAARAGADPGPEDLQRKG